MKDFFLLLNKSIIAKCLTSRTSIGNYLRILLMSKADYRSLNQADNSRLPIVNTLSHMQDGTDQKLLNQNKAYNTPIKISENFEHSINQENITLLQESLSGTSLLNFTTKFNNVDEIFSQTKKFEFFQLYDECRIKLFEPFRLYLINNQAFLIRLLGWTLNNPITTLKLPYSDKDNTNINILNENYLALFKELTSCVDQQSHTVQNYLFILRSFFDSQNHFRSPLIQSTNMKFNPIVIEWLTKFPESSAFKIRLQDGPKDCIDTILFLKHLGLQISHDDLKACLEICKHYGISQKDQIALQGLYTETQTGEHPLDRFKKINVEPSLLIQSDSYLEILYLLLRHRNNKLFREESILLLNYYSQLYLKTSNQELLSFSQVTKIADEILNIKKSELTQIIKQISLNGISKTLWLQLNAYNTRLTIPQVASLSLITALFHYYEYLPNSISDWASFRGRFLKFFLYNFEGISNLSTPRTLSLLFNIFNYITNKQESIFLLGKASLHCEYLQLASLIKRCIENISHEQFEFLVKLSHLDPNEYLQLIAGFMKYEIESPKLLDVLVNGFIFQHSRDPVFLEVEILIQILENLKSNYELPYNFLDYIINCINDDTGSKIYNAHEALQLSYNIHHLFPITKHISKIEDIFRSIYKKTNLRDFDSSQISQFLAQFKRISQNPLTPEANTFSCYILLENMLYFPKEAIIEVIEFLSSTHSVLNSIKYGPNPTFTPFGCILPILIKYLRENCSNFSPSEYLKIGRLLSEINQFSEIFKALIKQNFYKNHHLLNNTLFLKFVLMSCNNGWFEPQILEIFKQRCSKMKTLEIQEYEDFLSCLNFLDHKTKFDNIPSPRLIDINNLPITSLLDHLMKISLSQEIEALAQSPLISNYLKCLKFKLQDSRHIQTFSSQDYSNLSNIIHFLGKSKKYDLEFLDNSIIETAHKFWLSNQESKRLEFLFSSELDNIMSQLRNEPQENFGRLISGNFTHYSNPNERKAIILTTLCNKKMISTNPKEYIASSLPFDEAKIVEYRLRNEGWIVEFSFDINQFENNVMKFNMDRSYRRGREISFKNIQEA